MSILPVSAAQEVQVPFSLSSSKRKASEELQPHAPKKQQTVSALASLNIAAAAQSFIPSPTSFCTPPSKPISAQLTPESPELILGIAATAEPFTPPLKPKNTQLSPESPDLMLSPPESPDLIRGPSNKHSFSGFRRARLNEGFEGKPSHTLAPDSAEKQARVITNHYRVIQELRGEVQRDGKPRSFFAKKERAEILVANHGIRVKQDGRDRTFGTHKGTSHNPETGEVKSYDCLYPKHGTRIEAGLSGRQVLDLRDDYARLRGRRPSFPEYVSFMRYNAI